MARSWRLVKREIERELDKIWWDEPLEVTKSKLGLFPSGAGMDDQYFGNLYFQLADTQALGWAVVQPTLKLVLEDPKFDLEHCKKIWISSTAHRAKLLGGVDPPICPEPWLNLGKLNSFCDQIIESLPTVKSKEDFTDLLWSWFNYVNCLNRWFYLAFPWHLGLSLKRLSAEDVSKLQRLIR
jgi:Cucumopine synthase C-terminal helical bundle domain